jgi:signal transduction histidine kinase
MVKIRSGLSAAKRKSDPVPVKVSAITKEVVKLLRMSIPSTIEITLELNAVSDMVLADPASIHQILMNLCTNAPMPCVSMGKIKHLAVQVSTSGWIPR